MAAPLGPRACSVKPQEDYSILIRFNNGELREYDAKPLLSRGIFSALEDISLFMQAHLEAGTVVWNDDLDIAPELLYEQSVLVE